MEYTLHLHLRKQHIRVGDLPLYGQIAVLRFPLDGYFTHETEIDRSICVDLPLPGYPLPERMVEHLNKMRARQQLKDWHITEHDTHSGRDITPEEAARDTAKVQEKAS